MDVVQRLHSLIAPHGAAFGAHDDGGKPMPIVPSLTPGAQSLGPDRGPSPRRGGHPFGSQVERRQLSVMFCDLVNSTALSRRLDPEDLSFVIDGYQSRVAEAAARFGGFVSRYVGDGVIIYFGWPSAQEADAEQAVRAALVVIEAVGQSPVLGESLQVHIGIATGLALVGELMGAASPQQHTAIGETLNLAARLQSLAGPDCAVIDAATRRRIGGLFECRDLGPVTLKGMPDPVSAWEVTRAMSGSRSEALYSAEDLPPLVGRKDALSILLRLWHQAKAGDGRVVLLSGEPGIGKSRLTVSLIQQLRGEPHTKLCFLGSPQHQDSPLFPIIARVEQGGFFDQDEPPLSEVFESSSLRTPPPRAVSAEGKRERLLSALVKQLTDLAAQCPAIVVFEDVHWFDHTSLELLSLVVPLVSHLRILLLVSSRPGFSPSWAGLPHASTLCLNGLDRRETVELAKQTAGAIPLSPMLIEQIIARAEGIPLFIEELTRAAVDADWHDARCVGDPYSSGLPASAVPAALYAPLAARLDRLPDLREVVQVAAVIGREFTFELLEAVGQFPNGTLIEALVRLTEAGLISPCDATRQGGYAFRHALFRDVAYSMLLRDRRRLLHRHVAEALQRCSKEERQPLSEILAHHYTLAELMEPAVHHWLAAGRHSLRLAAYREAENQLRNGMTLLEALPDGGLRVRLGRELKSTLGLVRDGAKGYGHAFQSVFDAWRGTAIKLPPPALAPHRQKTLVGPLGRRPPGDRI